MKQLSFKFGPLVRGFRLKSVRRLYRHFGRHLRGHRSKLVGASLCMVGMTAMELLRPWPLKIVFDGILMPPDKSQPLLESLSNALGGTTGLLALAALLILTAAVFHGLFGFGQAYLLASAGQKVVASIRKQLYSHIQRLSHSFHDQRRLGDLLARLEGDVRLMRELMVSAAIYISGRLLVLFGMLAVMLWMDWQLTLVALAIVPLLGFSVGRFGREIKGAAKRQRRKESQTTTVMTESISAITVVQAFAREAYEEERFSRRNNSSVKAGLVATRLTAHLDRLVQVILAIGTCGVIWFGVLRVQAGWLTPGDLLVFSAYLAGLYKPIRKLASLTGRISKAIVCGERILSILEIEPEVKDAPDAVSAPRFRGAIEFADLEFSYAPSTPVLRGLNLRIAPGETVALAGESGSGKSTIASLLLRFYDPVAGSVRIDGTDIRRYTLVSLREQIAIVLQESVLFGTTIRENIAYGKLTASPEEIVAAAKAANAHDFIEDLPDGYDTVVGERGATLSGGQRQRIAVARAIIRDAPLVILDEPMAGLDAGNEAAVRDALAHLTADRTCLLITHDPWAAVDADRILTIKDGRILDATTELRGGGRSEAPPEMAPLSKRRRKTALIRRPR